MADSASREYPVSSAWRIRDFHDDDLDQTIRLLEECHDTEASPVVSLDEVVAAVRSGQPAFVVQVGGDLVAAIVSTVSAERA